MRMHCPHCKSVARTLRSEWMSSRSRELVHACTSHQCGHIFKSLQEITGTIMPPVKSNTEQPDNELAATNH